jgi:hypothetical protein
VSIWSTRDRFRGPCAYIRPYVVYDARYKRRRCRAQKTYAPLSGYPNNVKICSLGDLYWS